MIKKLAVSMLALSLVPWSAYCNDNDPLDENLKWAAEMTQVLPSMPDKQLEDLFSQDESNAEKEDRLQALKGLADQAHTNSLDQQIVWEEVQPATITSPEGAKGVPEMREIRTCRETRNLVEVIIHQEFVEGAAEKQQIKKCKGHRIVDIFNECREPVENRVVELKKQYRADEAIAEYKVAFKEKTVIQQNRGGRPEEINGFEIFVEYKHKDNTSICDCFDIEQGIPQLSDQRLEKGFWKSDRPEKLAEMEADPRCQFLYSKTEEGSRKRDLYFRCEQDSKDSDCAELRSLGGILINKECEKENEREGCLSWIKTYMFWKSPENTSTVTDVGNFFGPEGKFHKAQEKRSDFTETASVQELIGDLRYSKQDGEGNGLLFPGEAFECTSKFSEASIDDCCKTLAKDLVEKEMFGCSSEEKKLAGYRNEERCHYVGKKIMSNQGTTKVFCCFASKRAKILQEYVKKDNWGSADKPNCQGLTMDEFQQIDLKDVDFSKADKTYDCEAMTKTIHSFIEEHLQQGLNGREKK